MTRWIYSRLPIDAELTPEEQAGATQELWLGAWEPFGYDPRGQWLLLRRRATWSERFRAAWTRTPQTPSASPQQPPQPALRPTSVGGGPTDLREIESILYGD